MSQSWRDIVLDYIAAGNPVDPEQLRLFLADVREIDEYGTAPWNTNIVEWTREHLKELARPRRNDPTLNRLWWRRAALTGIFSRHIGAAAQPLGLREWRAIVAAAESALGSLTWPGRVLTPEQRAQIILDDKDNIREPKEMALWLLHLACRPKSQELSDFRRQMAPDRDPGPAPLGSRPIDASLTIVAVALPPTDPA